MREWDFKEKEKITAFSKGLNMSECIKSSFILRMIDGYVKGETRQKMCSKVQIF